MGLTWHPVDDELVQGVPTACEVCGEVVKVAERWDYDGELDAFGKADGGTWVRLVCRCGNVEAMVRAEELLTV